MAGGPTRFLNEQLAPFLERAFDGPLDDNVTRAFFHAFDVAELVEFFDDPERFNKLVDLGLRHSSLDGIDDRYIRALRDMNKFMAICASLYHKHGAAFTLMRPQQSYMAQPFAPPTQQNGISVGSSRTATPTPTAPGGGVQLRAHDYAHPRSQTVPPPALTRASPAAMTSYSDLPGWMPGLNCDNSNLTNGSEKAAPGPFASLPPPSFFAPMHIKYYDACPPAAVPYEAQKVRPFLDKVEATIPELSDQCRRILYRRDVQRDLLKAEARNLVFSLFRALSCEYLMNDYDLYTLE